MLYATRRSMLGLLAAVAVGGTMLLTPPDKAEAAPAAILTVTGTVTHSDGTPADDEHVYIVVYDAVTGVTSSNTATTDANGKYIATFAVTWCHYGSATATQYFTTPPSQRQNWSANPTSPLLKCVMNFRMNQGF